ncbi:tyrosine-protein kinase TXK-like [Babylonia areolata]|uniref:tyrosine-protein kinase TXK-like n=1 Tax=Babylonia areolata TaxID=304850 RepID=UPI003FD4DE43
MANPDFIVLSGCLLKKPQNKGFFSSETYRERFFILTKASLMYFDGSAKKPGKKRGEIPLRMIKAVENVEDGSLDGKINAFQVAYVEGSEFFTLYLVASSSTERVQWVRAIRNEAMQQEALFFAKYHRGVWTKALGHFTCCKQEDPSPDGGCVFCTTERQSALGDFVEHFQQSVRLTTEKTERVESACYEDLDMYETADEIYEEADETPIPMPSRPKSLHPPPPPSTRPPRPQSARPPRLPSVPSLSHPPPPPPPPVPVRDPVKEQEKLLYVAVYDFEPAEEGDLQLCKGEEFEILDYKKENWWLAKNKNGKQGYIPSNYVKNKSDLEIYDWYYKDLTRKQADDLLKQNKREGCFLVRPSEKFQSRYTLSVFTLKKKGSENDNVWRYLILTDTDGMLKIHERKFPNIPEMINYYKNNDEDLVTLLTCAPSRNVKPTTAGFGHSLFEIDPEVLEVGEELGSGASGTVHTGTFRGTCVAIKQIKGNAMEEKEFLEEAKIMTQFCHKNLVQLYGVVTKERPMRIVTELMRNGALNLYLQRHAELLKDQTPRLIDFCLQVCQGMLYLENRNFIHRDLAARNCLLGKNNLVKVADFGLSRHASAGTIQGSMSTKFPVRWTPPEVFELLRFSIKSDVWSFGILMWEIFTCGQMPYGKKRNQEVVNYVIHLDGRLEQPSNAPDDVYTIMKKCWHKEPETRPKFRELYQDLKVLRDNSGDLKDIYS